MGTFLEIANRVFLEEDDDIVETLEGDNLPEHVVRMKNFINDGYKYCYRNIFESDNFTKEGCKIIMHGAEPINITAFSSLKINGSELKIIPYQELKDLENIEQVYGRPVYAALFKKKLYFFPCPDKEYFLHYIGRIKFYPLEDNDDEPVIDSDIIVHYAKFAQKSYDNGQQDGISYQFFKESLNMYKRELNNSRIHQVVLPKIMVDE